MYCIHCGKEIGDDSIFCPNCGIKIGTEPTSSAENQENNSNALLNNNTSNKLRCPQCGSNKCTPLNQQNVSSKGGGYGCLSGGLGFLLLGPFGLLCGLCGRSAHTSTTNTVVWVCSQCGTTFRSEVDLRNEQLLNAMRGLCLTYGVTLIFLFTVGLLLSNILAHYLVETWEIVFIMLFGVLCAVLWRIFLPELAKRFDEDPTLIWGKNIDPIHALEITKIIAIAVALIVFILGIVL